MGDDKIAPRHADELAHCFAEHARKLFGYACALAREDLALAEELVQATFEAAGRAWQELREQAEEQRHGWLRSTVADIAASRFGRDGGFRDPAAGTEGGDQAAGTEGGDGVAGTEGGGLGSVDPAEGDSGSAEVERCWRVIREMPEREYAITLLRWQLDMKEAEIAAVLGVPEKTVSAQLSRARHKLIGQPGPDQQGNRDDPGGISS